MTEDLVVDVHLDDGFLARTLRADVLQGLSAEDKELPPKWFYDERGSALFDEITKLPEYYLTRCETEILTREASRIAEITTAETLVELGSGTSTKTRLLLDALSSRGCLECFAPFDVSVETLQGAARTIATAYPGLRVQAVAGDFEHHLHEIPADGRRMISFLGSTIGNLTASARKGFLSDIASCLRPGEAFLLGADLVKDKTRLEAAYNDSRGVTEAFNKNVLSVLNRELHADFDPDLFAHVARWDEDNHWVEMRLVAQVAHSVAILDLDLEIDFTKNDSIRTEISTKFKRDSLEEELGGAGLQVAEWWTDSAGDFALTLAVPI